MEVEKTVETFSHKLEDTDCVMYIGVEGRIILRGMLKKWPCNGQWRAFAKTIVDVEIPINGRSFLTRRATRSSKKDFIP